MRHGVCKLRCLVKFKQNIFTLFKFFVFTDYVLLCYVLFTYYCTVSFVVERMKTLHTFTKLLYFKIIRGFLR